MAKLIRHELVEVVIPAGSTATKFLIPDLPNLRNVHIFGLQTYCKEIVPNGIQTQNAVIDQPTLAKSFITLVNYGGKEFLKQAPGQNFQEIMSGLPVGAILPNTTFTKRDFVGQRVNYPKSYIEFVNAPAIPGVTQVFMFSVYYSLPAAEERKESGFSFSKKG